jgi:sugar phosphate isomerase/epimerase
MFEYATAVGARGVQILSGPVRVEKILAFQMGQSAADYDALLGLPEDDLLATTAANVAELADRAGAASLLLYLEPLAWCPISGVRRAARLIDAAARSNVKLVIDFWHCRTAGDSPEDVARLPKEMIYGVHVCDGLPFTGGVPVESVLRDVPTGEGVIDLKIWVDAVRSTGYVGWWAAETFSRKMQQQPPAKIASEMRALLVSLLGPSG